MGRQDSVVAFDLTMGCTVSADDYQPADMRDLCYRGKRQLICLACHKGWDRPAPADVPVVFCAGVPGRIRPHFRHPRRMGFDVRHSPASCWHAEAEIRLAAWAKRQGVTQAIREVWLADCRRRCDIAIQTCDGTELAIEIQQARLSDESWWQRHASYQKAGILDIWVWDQNAWIPPSARYLPQTNWRISRDLTKIGIPLARPHLPTSADDQESVAEPHHPPCPGDTMDLIWADLDRITLTGQGLGPEHT